MIELVLSPQASRQLSKGLLAVLNADLTSTTVRTAVEAHARARRLRLSQPGHDPTGYAMATTLTISVSANA